MKKTKKLLPTYLPILYLLNIFFGSLLNDTFSNLKLNVFIITGFVCSNKYMKQIVLINHSWISPTSQRKWTPKFCLFSKNGGDSFFFQNKERLVK